MYHDRASEIQHGCQTRMSRKSPRAYNCTAQIMSYPEKRAKYGEKFAAEIESRLALDTSRKREKERRSWERLRGGGRELFALAIYVLPFCWCTSTIPGSPGRLPDSIHVLSRTGTRAKVLSRRFCLGNPSTQEAVC